MFKRAGIITTIAAVIVLAISGCGSVPAVEPVAAAKPEVSAPAVVEPVTFAAIGDSITVWTETPERSWTSYAGTDTVTFSGQGWAQGGSGIEKMRDNTPVITADVLVIMAGTNYVGGPMPLDQRLTLIDEIVQKSQAGRVLIAGVPPFNKFAPLAVEWNTALEQHAVVMGWGFVNPWTSLTTPDSLWVAGYSEDNVHPTPEASSIVGPIMSAAIEAEGR